MLTLGGISRRFKTHTPPHTHTLNNTCARTTKSHHQEEEKAVCDEILVELEIISL